MRVHLVPSITIENVEGIPGEVTADADIDTAKQIQKQCWQFVTRRLSFSITAYVGTKDNAHSSREHLANMYLVFCAC